MFARKSTLISPPKSDFSVQVIRMVKKIPKGQVACYGQIAKLAGKEHGSRGVAWILSSSSEKYELPWHRVINVQGKISFRPGSKNFREQRRRLMAEGIEVSRLGAVDLLRYQWKKTKKSVRRPKNSPKMFQ